MDLTFFFRLKIPGTYSIEGIFEPIAERIPGAKAVYVPFIGNGFLNIVKNILYCRNRQGRINHITGDIHYAILGLSRKNKNILTIHDCGILYDESKPKWKREVIKYLWFKWPSQMANRITTVSEKSKQELLECTGCAPSKVIVIPNYVNPAFVFISKEFNELSPRLLHIGSTKNKNLPRIIKAIAGLNCELRIIGTISALDRDLLELHHIVYHQLQGVSLKEIQKEYREADIVLFVSTYEGFGLPILEAQATGRVLITSNISPCREVAGEGAICIDPTNVNEIGNAIQNVIHNAQLRTKVIEAGLENVKEYAMENIIMQYRQLYEL